MLVKELSEAEVALRKERLESVVNDLLEASVKVCTKRSWRASTARSASTPPSSRFTGAGRRARVWTSRQ